MIITLRSVNVDFHNLNYTFSAPCVRNSTLLTESNALNKIKIERGVQQEVIGPFQVIRLFLRTTVTWPSAVVAFRLNFHCDGKSEHLKYQSNRHKLHLRLKSVCQPLYACLYPSMSFRTHFALLSEVAYPFLSNLASPAPKSVAQQCFDSLTAQ